MLSLGHPQPHPVPPPRTPPFGHDFSDGFRSINLPSNRRRYLRPRGRILKVTIKREPFILRPTFRHTALYQLKSLTYFFFCQIKIKSIYRISYTQALRCKKHMMSAIYNEQIALINVFFFSHLLLYALLYFFYFSKKPERRDKIERIQFLRVNCRKQITKDPSPIFFCDLGQLMLVGQVRLASRQSVHSNRLRLSCILICLPFVIVANSEESLLNLFLNKRIGFQITAIDRCLTVSCF